MPYFHAFADLLNDYPAHLHVNVATEWQGLGVGRTLVARCVDACRSSGAKGIHVVTVADAPNIGFYEKCGLARVAQRVHNGRALLMLGTS